MMNAPTPKTFKGRKYDQVLDGARSVFIEHGFANANMDEVARRARVSKATVYSYFSDKVTLFFEVINAECMNQANMAIELIDRNAPVKQVLTQAGRQMIGFMTTEFSQRMFRICVSEADRFPELGRAYYETGPRMGREKFAEYFQEACARGELCMDDFSLAAEQFVELCKSEWWPKMLFGLNAAPDEKVIAKVVDSAVEMFLARYGS
jgi:TetR/AcrR family transcriptional repressor of mexJK operon